jgi:hypothetical protein
MFQEAVGIVPAVVLKSCWYFEPAANSIVAPLALVTVPELLKVPWTDRSVPLPFAIVRVIPALTIICAPDSRLT